MQNQQPDQGDPIEVRINNTTPPPPLPTNENLPTAGSINNVGNTENDGFTSELKTVNEAAPLPVSPSPQNTPQPQLDPWGSGVPVGPPNSAPGNNNKHRRRLIFVALLILLTATLSGALLWWYFQMRPGADDAALRQEPAIYKDIAQQQNASQDMLEESDELLELVTKTLTETEPDLTSEKVQSELNTLKAAAESEINRRQKVLNFLKVKAANSQKLTNAHQRQLDTLLGDQISGLTKLHEKIRAEKSLDQLKVLVKDIKSEYRVYIMVVPKTALMIASDRQIKSGGSLEEQVTKLNAAIARAEAQGKKVGELKKMLEAVRVDLENASQRYLAVSDVVAPLNIDDFNKNKEILLGQRDKLKEAQKLLKTSRESIALITQKLKELSQYKVQPNIVYIMADDLDFKVAAHMPNTKKLIADNGVSFDNYITSIALCCPSRMSILRGQYAHNTGISGNDYPWGGYQAIREKGLENSTIATWMQDAGYKTAMMGKYFNGYPAPRDGTTYPGQVSDTYVPPGWNQWASPVKGWGYAEYNYTMNENGQKVKYGNADEDYMVDVISRKTDEFIRKHQEKPYFMYLSTFAPHSPANSAKRHADKFKDLAYPASPSFDEPGIADKPSIIKNLPKLSEKEKQRMLDTYRKRVRSAQAIDDLVKNTVDTLKATNQYDRTYIIFTSDNGFHLGEHRMGGGKHTPYEEDIRVPFYMSGPGIKPGTRVDEVTGNIDIAPTLADMVGAKTPDFVDGKSFFSLATKQKSKDWRQFFYVERTHSDKPAGQENGQSLDEPSDATIDSRAQGRLVDTLAYKAVRSKNFVYIEYVDGQKEMYDLRKDPHQLNNLLGEGKAPKALDSSVLTNHMNAVNAIKNCKAATCNVRQ